MDKFTLAVGLPAVVTRDDSGLEKVKGQVLMFATAGQSSPYYAESIRQAGFADELERIQDLVAHGDMKGALRVVSDEMADAFTLAGTADRIRRRMKQYQAEGAAMVVNPSPPNVYFPLYQGHFPQGAEMPQFSFPEYLNVISDTIELLGN